MANAIDALAQAAPKAINRPGWATWVTPHHLLSAPVHRWFTFPHSFSSELISALIGKWGLCPDDRVLDPFVGAGTTLVACQEKGIPSEGIDLSPLAALSSRVKTSPPSGDALGAAWAIVRSVQSDSRTRTYPELVERAFPGKLLDGLDSMKTVIESLGAGPRTKEALLLALLAILPRFSRLIRKGGWLSERQESLTPSRIVPEMDRQIAFMTEDLEDWAPTASARVRISDARQLPLSDESVSAVMTSPPYPNRHDYTRVFGVELQFAFLDWEKTRKLRYQSLQSHPEARPKRPVDGRYEEPRELKSAIERLQRLTKKENAERRVPPMLQGYFRDMYFSLREMSRVLRPGGKIALVLGNVQYLGVPFRVDRWTAEIGCQVGLTPLDLFVARRRGNSAQQMKKHGRRPQRESVVVLEKGTTATVAGI